MPPDRAHIEYAQGLIDDWQTQGLITAPLAERLRAELSQRTAPRPIVAPKPAPSEDVVAHYAFAMREDIATASEEKQDSLQFAPAEEPEEEAEEEAQIAEALEEHLPDGPQLQSAGLLGKLRARDLAVVSSEGVLWFVGVLLVLSGSLYFTRTNWAQWSEGLRATVVTGGLIAYAYLFGGLAKLIELRSEHRAPSRILGGIAMGLVPISGIALMGLIRAQGSLLLTSVLGLACAGVGFVAAGRFHAKLRGGMSALALASACSLALLAIPASSMVQLFKAMVALLPIAAAIPKFLRDDSLDKSDRAFVWLTGGYLAAATTTVLLVQHPQPALLGPVLGLAALTASRVTTAPALIATLAMAVLAPIAALTGPLVQVPFRVLVLASASLSTVSLIKSAKGRALPIGLAATTGLLVYYFIPAPFTSLIQAMKSGAQSALGYGSKPLPIAYYGLTFLPYLGLLLGVRRKLQSERFRHAIDVWLVLVSLGLIGLAFTGLPDVRPITMTLPIYGLAFFFASKRSEYSPLILVSFPCLLAAAGFGFHESGHLLTAVGATAMLVSEATRRLLNNAKMAQGQRIAAALLLLCLLSIQADLPAAAFWTAALLLRASLGQRDRRSGQLLAGAGFMAPLLLLSTSAQEVIGQGSVNRFLVHTIGALVLTAAGLGLERLNAQHRLKLHWGRAARALAPLPACAAVVFGIEQGIGAPLIVPCALLLAAPHLSGRALWALPAALLSTAAVFANHGPLEVPRHHILIGATILWGVITRAAALRSLTTFKGQRLQPPLRLATALLCVGALIQTFDITPSLGELSMLTLACLVSFLAVGVQLYYGAAIGLTYACSLWGLGELLKLGPIEVALFTCAFGHALCGLSRWTRTLPDRSTVYRCRPSTGMPLMFTVFGCMLTLIGLTVAVFEPEHQLECAALALAAGSAAWHAARISLGRKLAHRRLRFVAENLIDLSGVVSLSILTSLSLGLEWVPCAVSFGGLGLLWVVERRARPTRASFLAFSLLALGLVCTGFVITQAQPAICAGLLFVALLRFTQKRPGPVMVGVTTLSGWLFAVLGAFALGGVLDGGPIAQLPLAALAIYVMFELLGLRAERLEHARWTWAQLSLLACLSLLLLEGLGLRASVGGVHTVQQLLFVTMFIALLRVTRRTQKAVYAWLAQVVLALIWLKIRSKSPWLQSLENANQIAMIALAFVLSGVHALAKRGARGAPFAKVSHLTALALPVVAAASSGADAPMALAAALAYAFAGRMGASKWTGPLAALMFNVASCIFLDGAGVRSPQLYVLPVSVSLLLLSQLYQRELSPGAMSAIRLVALGGAYLSGFVSVLAFSDPGQALLMAVVCVAGIALGVVLQLRSYLLLGAGFLVIDLGTNIFRFGLQGGTQATLVLTGLGLSILSVMVAWSLHKAALKLRISEWNARMASWEF